MKRRDFLTIGIPATGAIMIAPGLLSFQVYNEIGWQFSGEPEIEGYDLVINGAGVAGYFAAIAAAKKGLKVLVVERRTSPGFDIAAKRKLWIGSEGLDGFDKDLMDLFFPEQEKFEIQKTGGTGPNNSRFVDELLLLAGTIKKGLLRNLLVSKVHLLLMTDVCGLLTDGKNVNGVLLACKHGLYSVNCRNFIDASDNLIFSHRLFDQKCHVQRAGFVLELLGVTNSSKRTIKVPEELGLYNNQLIVHPGKNSEKQAFIEFEFNAEGLASEEIEFKSRKISAQIGKNFEKIDPSFTQAKIHWYGLESSLYYSESSLPETGLKGYLMHSNTPGPLTCRSVTGLRTASNQIIERLEKNSSGRRTKEIIIAGARIPFEQITQSMPVEPGLSIPLKKCSFPYDKYITNKSRHQVVVAGAGTSGSLAGIGSLESGADTMVAEYFNDFGGTRTMGGVIGYYHGMKKNRLLNRLDEDGQNYQSGLNLSPKIGLGIYLLDRFITSGGNYLSGSIICDAVVNGKKVEGILVCTHGTLKILNGDVTIDATGDGDIAAFAGAAYHHGNPRTGKTQNYSQWNLSGGGKSPSNVSNDYDIINNTKISELQRGLFLSHYEAHFYDFYPYLTVRESRRIEGKYTLNLIDAVEPTHFEDIISLASSDYDPHYAGNSEFTRCGFLLPHSNIVQVEIPYRSIVPKNLDGLLITGKAISQTHNALQFTRMNADIAVLGHLTGQVAASCANGNIDPGDFKIHELQKEWFGKGYIPEEYASKQVGNKTNDIAEINRRIQKLAQGEREYLYECIRLNKGKAVPVLKEAYESIQNKEGKLLVAKALAWFGQTIGNHLVEEELNELFREEMKTGYPGGYIENYDFIRGREKNVLEGLFWKINQNIALLAMSGNPRSNKSIKMILENTTSGGKVISWVGERADYFNTRIDLRIIPFYNRILNLCFYAERLPDHMFITAFEKLLKDENITGYLTKDYHLTRWRIYGGNLELYAGAALARCGSKAGFDILLSYLDDIHFNFKDFALNELKILTNVDYKYNRENWKSHLDKQVFPRPGIELIKDIDV